MKRLLSKKGLSYPAILAVLASLLLIGLAIFEWARLTTITNKVRDELQSILINTATDNFTQLFPTLREGYSAGYVLNSSDNWVLNYSTYETVVQKLTGILGLQFDSDTFTKLDNDGNVIYTLSNMNIDAIQCTISPIGSDIIDFTITGRIDIVMPLSFGWERFPPLSGTIWLNAKWSARY